MQANGYIISKNRNEFWYLMNESTAEHSVKARRALHFLASHAINSLYRVVIYVLLAKHRDLKNIREAI